MLFLPPENAYKYAPVVPKFSDSLNSLKISDLRNKKNFQKPLCNSKILKTLQNCLQTLQDVQAFQRLSVHSRTE